MSASNQLARNRIIVGDAIDRLRRLPGSSVDSVVTSPPYFRLRDYAVKGQLGLESDVDLWVNHLLTLSAEIHRVLVPTGTYWLNLGDAYSSHPSQGADRKSLLMAPERVAMRLQEAGWIIRNKIVWAKPNPVPSSVPDRLNCTYEVIYVLAKQPTYFFDLEAIRQPHLSAVNRSRAAKPGRPSPDAWLGPNAMAASGLHTLKSQGRVGHPLGKNPGDVWTIAPGRYRSAHHAVFPQELAERMIAAGCPEARCVRCRQPWKRRVIRSVGGSASRSALVPTCQCGDRSEPGLVLDPFMGSGTTAVAAENLGRDWLGVELNPVFADVARERIAATRQHSQIPPPERAAA
ncbi:DNA-methyltransferase [Mycobacterium sp. Aquia_213]|uniref:DNA-methyltransferase n=1 Tax=Mycobacterium sp. Aquia_213 TaxID=2991728 RepID=UPI00226EA800|nr:site-specific DNA-methyltransferase [Mycobacterium sp. Aquia_213]WAC90226.1 site-specific DNA-methyltransferase [Mycobacterium sp. Aquia_213]